VIIPTAQKKAGHEARQSRGPTKRVKTFQRERPTRYHREEESDAALNSTNADIGCIVLFCNAACIIKGLQRVHGSYREPPQKGHVAKLG
jgi:hypothetical protein